MDPRLNPFAPGAGTLPPELAGLDLLSEDAAVALNRIRAGRSARSVVSSKGNGLSPADHRMSGLAIFTFKVYFIA